jgi:hypothetical protein
MPSRCRHSICLGTQDARIAGRVRGQAQNVEDSSDKTGAVADDDVDAMVAIQR